MIMRFPGGLKKALTLSYDDGVEQDEQLIPILDAHGVRGTFNISSGLYCPEGRVYEPGRIHRPMTFARAKALYDTSRHEVAVHCLTHANLPELPTSMVVGEVMRDRENLEREFGGVIRGMAYPFGAYNSAVVQALSDCGIAYSRTVQSTHAFDFPENWLMLHPTCHHADPQLFALCDRFLADEARFSSKLFYLWGHSYEFERRQLAGHPRFLREDGRARRHLVCDEHRDRRLCQRLPQPARLRRRQEAAQPDRHAHLGAGQSGRL